MVAPRPFDHVLSRACAVRVALTITLARLLACAKALLAHERSGIAGVARSKRGLERLRQMASTELSDAGGALIQDAFFRRKVAELEIDLTALEFTELRTLAGESSGKGPGPAANSGGW
jgi:alkylation response protein AidB-like acyl-CoA dehydrogenase